MLAITALLLPLPPLQIVANVTNAGAPSPRKVVGENDNIIGEVLPEVANISLRFADLRKKSYGSYTTNSSQGYQSLPIPAHARPPL